MTLLSGSCADLRHEDVPLVDRAHGCLPHRDFQLSEFEPERFQTTHGVCLDDHTLAFLFGPSARALRRVVL